MKIGFTVGHGGRTTDEGVRQECAHMHARSSRSASAPPCRANLALSRLPWPQARAFRSHSQPQRCSHSAAGVVGFRRPLSAVALGQNHLHVASFRPLPAPGRPGPRMRSRPPAPSHAYRPNEAACRYRSRIISARYAYFRLVSNCLSLYLHTFTDGRTERALRKGAESLKHVLE